MGLRPAATGAIVAAARTPLPEGIGGVRNWDYRYTWLRDSALILDARRGIGYHAEAADFSGWLERLWAVAVHGRAAGQARQTAPDAPPEALEGHLTCTHTVHATRYHDHGMAEAVIAKAAFKARALEILRQVQATGEAILVTDRGRPVVRVAPYYGDEDALLASLRGTVLRYDEPLDPVAEADWEALR